MNKPIIVTGAPGSGKTTNYVKEKAKKSDFDIFVLEPVQKIVNEKRQPGLLKNIHFINYASGFSKTFYFDKVFKNGPESIIIIDEAHQLFFSEYRNFYINGLKEILTLFDEVIFITATPEILKKHLAFYKIEYIIDHKTQYYSRLAFKIRIIPTTYSKYINSTNLWDYDIVLVNNIKSIYKTLELVPDRTGEFSVIYSYYNENNNLFFEKTKIKDDRWLGTCSMGQGIDKKKVINDLKGKILFDGNSFASIPDTLKDYFKSAADVTNYDSTLFTVLGENVIQSDRFRMDLKEVEIDILIDKTPEQCQLLADILLPYYKSVYENTKNFEITIGDSLWAGRLDNFNQDKFDNLLEKYDIWHAFNQKTTKERFLELLDSWANPVKGYIRVKKISYYKNTLLYIKSIFKKYYGGLGEKYELVFFDNQLDKKIGNTFLQLALIKFQKFLIDSDIKKLVLQFLNKEDKIDKDKDYDINTELYLQLGYFGESLLQILMGHYGFKYNTTDSKNKRSGSPIQLLSKFLRVLIINMDIDITGAHIVAFIKSIMGNTFVVTNEMIESIYSYDAIGGKDKAISHLQTFKKLANKSKLDIEKELGNEREIAKKVIVSSLNRLQKDLNYVKWILANVIPEIKTKKIKLPKSLRGFGYYNGIKYEDLWLEEYLGYRGVIYRISDGLAQIYGNPEILNEIKNTIMKKHLIPVKNEDLSKYPRIPGLKTLDDFIREEEELWKGKEITDEIYIQSFYDCIDAMESFRKYLVAGKKKGKAVGKAVGKTVGKTVGKAVHIKKYEVLEDLVIKKTGVTYAKGVYDWVYIPKDIPKSYRVKYLRKI